MAKQPVVHVLRAPLPWRPSRLTECGLLAEKVGRAVALAIAHKLYAEDKELVCASCVQVWGTRNETSLEREVAWSRRNRHKDHFVEWELLAIRELVTRYQPEFDRLVAALQSEQALQKVGG